MRLKKNIPKCIHITPSAIKNHEKQSVMNRIYADFIYEKIDSQPISNEKKMEIIEKLILFYKNQ